MCAGKRKTLLEKDTYEIKEIMIKIFDKGVCIYDSPSVMEIKEYCKKELETIWDETKRLVNPHNVYVDLSDKLYDMKKELLDSHGKN